MSKKDNIQVIESRKRPWHKPVLILSIVIIVISLIILFSKVNTSGTEQVHETQDISQMSPEEAQQYAKDLRDKWILEEKEKKKAISHKKDVGYFIAAIIDSNNVLDSDRNSLSSQEKENTTKELLNSFSNINEQIAKNIIKSVKFDLNCNKIKSNEKQQTAHEVIDSYGNLQNKCIIYSSIVNAKTENIIDKLEINRLYVGGSQKPLYSTNSSNRLTFNGNHKLDSNTINNLPKFKYLHAFVLSNSTWAELPKLHHLQNLRFLRITDSVYTRQLLKSFENTSVEVLDISDNRLVYFPKSLKYFKNIKVLDIRDSKVKALPKSIDILSSLLKLDASNNQIQILPNKIGELSRLQELDLRNNNIQDLPDSIGSLKDLKMLILYNNPQLKTIPKSIVQLKNLENLYIGKTQIDINNPILKQLKENGVSVNFE